MPTFWKLNEILIFFGVIILTYGVVQGLRKWAPGDEWTWTRWWGYKYGDMGVAAFFGFAAVCFHHYMPHGWYTEAPHTIQLFALCMIGSVVLWLIPVATHKMTWDVATMPSELYHTVMRGVLLYFGIQAEIGLLSNYSHWPRWVFWAAQASLVYYVFMFLVYDSFLNPLRAEIQARGHR